MACVWILIMVILSLLTGAERPTETSWIGEYELISVADPTFLSFDDWPDFHSIVVHLPEAGHYDIRCETGPGAEVGITMVDI